MTTLPNERVVEIAKAAAKANNISFTSVTTASAFDSTGTEAIEIKIVLTSGSSDKIMGERSARTVSDVIRGLADAGEVRFPIVRYEERIATSKS